MPGWTSCSTRSLRRHVLRASIRSPTSTRGGLIAATLGRRTWAGASTTRSSRRISGQRSRGRHLQGAALLRSRAAHYRLRPVSASGISRPAAVVDDRQPWWRGWLKAIAAYRHPRVLAMLFLGFSAGLPFMLVFTTLSAWLRELGIDRTTIGMLSAGFAHTLKFFWAPVVDRLHPPSARAVPRAGGAAGRRWRRSASRSASSRSPTPHRSVTWARSRASRCSWRFPPRHRTSRSTRGASRLRRSPCRA